MTRIQGLSLKEKMSRKLGLLVCLSCPLSIRGHMSKRRAKMEEQQNWMKSSERKRSLEIGLIQQLSRESPVMGDFQLRTPIPRHGARIPAVLMKSARLTLVAALNANVGLDLDDPANVLLARNPDHITSK